MMQSWNPNDLIQLGDSSYNTSSSSLLDYNIGQYYNNYIYPYAPPEFVTNSIYTKSTEGGLDANTNPLSNKQWTYNLYDYPNGFGNPLNGNIPGGSSDKLNHYWIVPGNHDEATIIGSYSDSNVNQIDFPKFILAHLKDQMPTILPIISSPICQTTAIIQTLMAKKQ